MLVVSPTSRTRRRTCSSRCSSSVIDSYAARRQPDRERRGDARRRDQAGRGEVVVRAPAERERDRGDEHDRRGDLAGAGAALPAGVEARLPEDEPGDRDEERQPLRRARFPEQVPEDRVAEDDAAQDERRVEAEREPERVEPGEHRDREHAPDGRAGGAPREEVRPRRADVALAGGRARSARRAGSPRAGAYSGAQAGNGRRDGVRPGADGVAGDDAAAQLRAGLGAHRRARPPRGRAAARRAPRRRAAGSESSSGRPARNSFSAALLASTGTPHAAAS